MSHSPPLPKALDRIDNDPTTQPAHVLRFGTQTDMQGLISGSKDTDRRIGYLTKYLTKAVADTYGDDDHLTGRQLAHIDQLHEETRWLPCSEHCPNWLRFGIQPRDPEPGMAPGDCGSKAHRRENIGCGGRRVLVSRKWTGKRLDEHKADRRSAVEEVLEAAGIEMPEADRLSANTNAEDGLPRYRWEPLKPAETELPTYREAILAAIEERPRWREQYETAKARTEAADAGFSATGPHKRGGDAA